MASCAFQNGFSLMRSYQHFAHPVYTDRHKASGEKSSFSVTSTRRLQNDLIRPTGQLQTGHNKYLQKAISLTVYAELLGDHRAFQVIGVPAHVPKLSLNTEWRL